MCISAKKPKILLISMPWAPVTAPSIQLGILKSALKNNHMHSDIEHLNLHFAATISPNLYNNIAFGPRLTLFCEWLFNANLKTACNTPTDESMSYLDYLNNRIKKYYMKMGIQFSDTPLAEYLGDSYRETIKHLKYVQIPEFISKTMNRIDFSTYDIVAFTCCLNQTMPTMAMAKVIKQHYPNIFTIVGGVAFDGSLGPEYLKTFGFIDFCIQGEGEITLPELVKILRCKKRKKNKDMHGVPGLCWRNIDSGNHQKIIVNPARKPLAELNQSPIPDYSDYFSTIESIKEEEGIEFKALMIYFESSRGCWWRKCTFCALNRLDKGYRSKSSSRVLNEIMVLSAKYKHLTFGATDNALDMRYFIDLLPALKSKNSDINIWYQLRTKMTKPQIKLLSESGVTSFHAGIESLHSGPLKIMQKGTLAIENIQLLKWCEQYQLDVRYNLLFGFPGEKMDYYEEMGVTIEKIKHLKPPAYPPYKMEIFRFGPYFCNPELYGIRRLEPKGDYCYIFPENADLSKIALAFNPTFLHDDGDEQYDYIKPIVKKLKRWVNAYHGNLNGDKPMLAYAIGPDFVEIYDARVKNEYNNMRLEGVSADIFMFCDKIQTMDNIQKMIREKYGQSYDGDDIKAIMQALVDRNVMISEGYKFLSLAVPIKSFR